MSDDRCGTCNRHPGCPECHQPYPGGEPGFYDEASASWRTGTRADHEHREPAEVRETAAARNRAQEKYDQARQRWEDAALAVRLEEQRQLSKPLVSTPNHGPVRPLTADDKNRVAQLRDERDALKEAMDRAGKAAADARVEHHAASKRAAAWAVS